jgi:radical SAM protein with 4Fe4S-binding SPASM domain
LGVKRIELLPVSYISVSDKEDLRPTLEDIENYLTFIEMYAKSLIEGNPAEIPTLVRFEDCLHRLMGFGNTVLACGAGRSFVCVGPNGVLYPCFRFAGRDDYTLGNCNKGIDIQDQEEFLKDTGRPASQRPVCSTCWATPVCGGPCFSVAEFFGPGSGMPDQLQCAYKLADIRSAFHVVEYFRKQNIQKLLEILSIELDAE